MLSLCYLDSVLFRQTGRQKMIDVPVTKEMWELANAWSQNVGELPNSIIKKGGGNIAGKLGELAVAQAFDMEPVEAFGYDLTVAGLKVEVKTSRRTTYPGPHFSWNYAITSAHQFLEKDPNKLVVFTSAHQVKKIITIVGWVWADRIPMFTFKAKGENNGRFRFSADCFTGEYRHLSSCEELQTIIEQERHV